jgi:hypothetical protein
LSRTGMSASAIYGYLRSAVNLSQAVDGSTGSGGASSGGSSGSGPGEWVPENQSGWSERARKFQAQITGRSGQAYRFNDVEFDGFDGTNLLDAKGPGYSNFLNKNGEWQYWFDPKKFVDRAERQFKAAGGRHIVWHFAEKDVADKVRGLVNGKVEVVHTPAAP